MSIAIVLWTRRYHSHSRGIQRVSDNKEKFLEFNNDKYEAVLGNKKYTITKSRNDCNLNIPLGVLSNYFWHGFPIKWP